MKTYGEIIRAKRKGYKLTMEQVAKEILSFKGYISGIESGKTPPPSAKVAKKLCDYLNLPLLAMLILAHCEKAYKSVKNTMLKLCHPAIQEVTG